MKSLIIAIVQKNGQEIQCANCGKPFYLSKSRLGKRRYCSLQCANDHNYGFTPVERACLVCGQPFLIHTPRQLTHALTCSPRCRVKNNVRQSTERKKATLVVTTCRWCGGTVLTNAYAPTHFCGGKSGPCHRAYQSHTRQGEDNPNYKGATTEEYRLRRSKRADELRQFVLLRDNHTCQDCGAKDVPLHTHHIKSWKEHPDLRFDPDNVVTLCADCHYKTGNFGFKVVNKYKYGNGASNS